MSFSAALSGELPKRQPEPNGKRRETNERHLQPGSDATDVSKNKRRKVKDEAEGSMRPESTSRRHDQLLSTDELADIKPDLIDLKRFQAMDDILRTMASGMTNETFREAATQQLLELALGQDLAMLPGEPALRECRDRLLHGGIVQEQDMHIAYDQVCRRLALQCTYWQAKAGRDDQDCQIGSAESRATPQKPVVQSKESDFVVETEIESTEDQDDEEADPTHVETESVELSIDSSEDAGDEESDDNSNGRSLDDDASDAISQALEPADSSRNKQPQYLQAMPRPKKRRKGSALPKITHCVVRGQDCITATNSPQGKDLFLAVAIDDLRDAGYQLEDSRSVRHFLETEVNKIWTTLGKGGRKRWGRYNSDLRRDQQLSYGCVRRLRDSQGVQWEAIFEYFEGQAMKDG